MKRSASPLRSRLIVVMLTALKGLSGVPQMHSAVRPAHDSVPPRLAAVIACVFALHAILFRSRVRSRGKSGTLGRSKKPFLVILSAVLAEALSGAKGKNLRNADSTRVRRPFTSFRFTWARFFDSPTLPVFPAAVNAGRGSDDSVMGKLWRKRLRVSSRDGPRPTACGSEQQGNSGDAGRRSEGLRIWDSGFWIGGPV